MSKTLLVFLVVFTILQIVLSQQQRSGSCNSIIRTPCKKDIECACNGPTRLICNYRKQCYRLSIFDIIYRQPCRGVFKKSCTTDDDCPCKTRKLVCEENECVKAKSTIVVN